MDHHLFMGWLTSSLKLGQWNTGRGALDGRRKWRSVCHCIVAGWQDSSKWESGRRSQIVGYRHAGQGHCEMDGAHRVGVVCLLESRRNASGEWIRGRRRGFYNLGCQEWKDNPDGTMIATGGGRVKVWDANTGKLLTVLSFGLVRCLVWTSDGKTLIAGSFRDIKKFDTANWTDIAVLEGHEHSVYGISLSPNERIPASASDDTTVRLWNLENDQPIGPPLHLEEPVTCAAFSADGMFLSAGCDDDHVYTWDVSAIVKKAGLEDLLSDITVNTAKKSSNADADPTRRRAPKFEGARRIPPGFFDDSSTSRGQHTAGPHQPTRRGRLPSSSPLIWVQNFVSGMLRRQHGSNRMPPIVEVPLTAGKPRNYHARKKPSASSSRSPNPHTTTTQQQSGGATQSNLSSQQPPAAATTSTALPTVTDTTGATSTISRPDITIQQAGWRARFLLWICCVPIQNTAGRH